MLEAGREEITPEWSQNQDPRMPNLPRAGQWGRAALHREDCPDLVGRASPQGHLGVDAKKDPANTRPLGQTRGRQG